MSQHQKLKQRQSQVTEEILQNGDARAACIIQSSSGIQNIPKIMKSVITLNKGMEFVTNSEDNWRIFLEFNAECWINCPLS